MSVLDEATELKPTGRNAPLLTPMNPPAAAPTVPKWIIGTLVLSTLIASLGWFWSSREARSQTRSAHAADSSARDWRQLFFDENSKAARAWEAMAQSHDEQAELQAQLDELTKTSGNGEQFKSPSDGSIAVNSLAQELVDSWVLSSDPSTWERAKVRGAATRAGQAVEKVIEAHVGPEDEECAKAVVSGYLDMAELLGRYSEQRSGGEFIVSAAGTQIRVNYALQIACDLPAKPAG